MNEGGTIEGLATSNGTHASFRHPSARDGVEVWRLARNTAVLDLNPPYAYALLLDRFSETCVVTFGGSELLGFVLGFVPPKQDDVLFVWQVAVSGDHRGAGIAGRMLDWLFERNPGASFLEATVAPTNKASARLFASFARRYAAEYTVSSHFSPAVFPIEAGPHEAEDLHRIGPIRPR